MILFLCKYLNIFIVLYLQQGCPQNCNLEKFSYLAKWCYHDTITLDVPALALCSKLCQHIVSTLLASMESTSNSEDNWLQYSEFENDENTTRMSLFCLRVANFLAKPASPKLDESPTCVTIHSQQTWPLTYDAKWPIIIIIVLTSNLIILSC